MAKTKRQIEFRYPEYFEPIPFPIRGPNLTWPANRQYGFGLSGGRASAKSRSAAQYCIEVLLRCRNTQVLVVRETATTLAQSFKAELEAVINEKGLHKYFTILRTEIRIKRGKGKIAFRPLSDTTSENIKSIANIELCIMEEAQQFTKDALSKLFATFREANVFFLAIWNPKEDSDPILEKLNEFISLDQEIYTELGFARPEIIHSTYLDNPWCSQATKLTASSVKRADPEYYEHEWMGKPLKLTRALILSNWRLGEVELDETWEGPYYGADFGSNDPTTLTGPVYINPGLKQIYIQSAACANTGQNSVSDARRLMEHVSEDYTIHGDNAAKQIILELQDSMIPIIGTPKPGVTSSLFNLRQYEIVLHPSCAEGEYTIVQELENYKWQQRKGRYVDIPIDEHNHFIDALRYALYQYI